MSSIFAITMTSLGESVFEGSASIVTLPGKEGEFAILRDHESMLVELQEGNCVIETPDTKHTYQLEGGVVEISGFGEEFHVRIVADKPTLLSKEGASVQREIAR
jgi:F0F1-type ATP synthase epsilon subunit